MRKRIEITTIERERIIFRAGAVLCPVCRRPSEMLTTAQAAQLARVRKECVRRWLSRNLAHGIKTCGGQHRICRNSLFEGAGDCIENEKGV